MAHTDFLLHMFRTLAVHSDSLGLNEEELAMLYEVLGGQYADTDEDMDKETASVSSFTRDMLTGRVPDPRAVGLAMQFVLGAVDELHSTEKGGNELSRQMKLVSRIHFHCLSFHIISVREKVTEAENIAVWSSHMDAAVSRGALAAATQACALPLEELSHLQPRSDATAPEPLIDILAPLSFTSPSGEVLHVTEASPVAMWSSGGHVFHLAPVPVCREPKNTVGLGDAISANALAYSLL